MTTQRMGKTQRWILTECLKRKELSKIEILSEYFGLQKSHYKGYSGVYFAGYFKSGNRVPNSRDETYATDYEQESKRNKAQVSLYCIGSA